MKLASLFTASVILLALLSAVQAAENPTSVAPSAHSNPSHETGSANHTTTSYPADEDLCWESPEWRGDTPDSQLTQAPHE
jgi:hypothetical protein